MVKTYQIIIMVIIIILSIGFIITVSGVGNDDIDSYMVIVSGWVGGNISGIDMSKQLDNLFCNMTSYNTGGGNYYHHFSTWYNNKSRAYGYHKVECMLSIPSCYGAASLTSNLAMMDGGNGFIIFQPSTSKNFFHYMTDSDGQFDIGVGIATTTAGCLYCAVGGNICDNAVQITYIGGVPP